jgi:hypothetical protein
VFRRYAQRETKPKQISLIQAQAHQKSEAYQTALATEDYQRAAAHDVKVLKKASACVGSIGLWKIKAAAKIQEAGQKLSDKLEHLVSEYESLQTVVNKLFAESSALDAATANMNDDLTKKRQLAATYVAQAKAELKAFDESLKDMDAVDAIKVTIDGVNAIGKRASQGDLKELASSVRNLKKSLDDHQRASRLRDKATSVGPAQPALPLHAVVHGLIEHFEDSVGSSIHEAKGGIRACYMHTKADLQKLLAPMIPIRRAAKQIQAGLRSSGYCNWDMKEPPVRRKLTKMIDANFDGNLQTTMVLPSKGEWVDKAGCPSCMPQQLYSYTCKCVSQAGQLGFASTSPLAVRAKGNLLSCFGQPGFASE